MSRKNVVSLLANVADRKRENKIKGKCSKYKIEKKPAKIIKVNPLGFWWDEF